MLNESSLKLSLCSSKLTSLVHLVMRLFQHQIRLQIVEIWVTLIVSPNNLKTVIRILFQLNLIYSNQQISNEDDDIKFTSLKMKQLQVMFVLFMHTLIILRF